MSAQPNPIEQLGLYAAEQELIAGDPYELGHVRADAARRAQAYRDEQLRLLAKGYGVCATENCDTMTTDVHCGRCQEELTGEYVDLHPLVWGFLAAACVLLVWCVVLSGQGIDWSYAKHLF